MTTMTGLGHKTERRRPSRVYPAYAVAVLGGISFRNAMDTSVLSGVISTVEPDLHISDAQYGLLANAFVNALAMVPLGYLSDARRRTRIIGIGIAIWSLATLATGATRTFPQILGARAVLGVGEATAMPAARI